MTYEVFYQFGGHSGPFPTEDDAAAHASSKQEQVFLTAQRTTNGVSGYLPTTYWTKSAKGGYRREPATPSNSWLPFPPKK